MTMPTEPERTPPVVRDPRAPRFPVVFEEPTFEQVRDSIGTRDYAQAALVSAACFPAGYFMARQIDRRLALRGMWFTGILGTLGGVMLAYQNTELRLKGFGRNDAEVARYGAQPPTKQADEAKPTE